MAEPNLVYSIPEIWDFCLEKIYDKPLYVAGLIELLEKYGISHKSLILDAGCGSGFPSIDLIDRGYRVIATDKSSEMVRQIKLNAEKRGLSIEAYQVMWQDLAKHFDPTFNFVYCRGNSLIYAASWEQNWLVPSRSADEIQRALQNFYAVMKPGASLYVDLTKEGDAQLQKSLGMVETAGGPIALSWERHRDADSQTSIWTVTLTSTATGQSKRYESYHYYLPRKELVQHLHEIGFKSVDECVPVTGENNYNVFIARK